MGACDGSTSKMLDKVKFIGPERFIAAAKASGGGIAVIAATEVDLVAASGSGMERERGVWDGEGTD